MLKLMGRLGFYGIAAALVATYAIAFMGAVRPG
jgi:hypothetical protein